MFLCFDFGLQLTPRAGNLGLMQSTSRIWVSANSGLEFGTQRPWRCHFKFFVFTGPTGAQSIGVAYGDFEAAASEAQRRQ